MELFWGAIPDGPKCMQMVVWLWQLPRQSAKLHLDSIYYYNRYVHLFGHNPQKVSQTALSIIFYSRKVCYTNVFHMHVNVWTF